MLFDASTKNITINEFPKAYNANWTPYNDRYDFKESTRKICAECTNCTFLNLKVCKVIIVGDLCVGKTALLNRFCHKIFDSDYRTTIGVDFHAEQMDIFGIPYHVQIWDTAGQERFKCIAQCYYRRAHVIMIVFDLSSIRTLANCKNWLRDALEASGDSETPYIFLIGSKKDLLSPEACKNTEDIAQSTARSLNAEYWSVSAKTGENINDLFRRVAALAFDDHIHSAFEEFRKKNPVEIANTDIISFKKKPKTKKKRIKCSKC